MLLRLLQTSFAYSSGAIVPTLYLSTIDLMSDPMKILGALGVIVQIIYVVSKTYIAWKDEREKDEDNE